MKDIPITDHNYGWNVKSGEGGVIIKLADGTRRTFALKSAEEFNALAALLNQSPVFYNTENDFIHTGWAEVPCTEWNTTMLSKKH